MLKLFISSRQPLFILLPFHIQTFENKGYILQAIFKFSSQYTSNVNLYHTSEELKLQL